MLIVLCQTPGTSRTAIRRVLDQKNTSITLSTIVQTAKSLGYRLRLSMEPVIEKVDRVHTPKKVAPLMDELGQACV